MLDDVFQLLETATKLEKQGNQRIEAATKYYEAVYLMKQVLQHTPHTPHNVATRNLLEEKIDYYSQAASRLYFDDSSTVAGGGGGGGMSSRSIASDDIIDPRSPFSIKGQNQQFFGGNNNNNNNNKLSSRNATTNTTRTTTTTTTNESIVNRKAHEATSLLSCAIDQDERGDAKAALNEYMKAAEAYLQVIKLSSSDSSSSSSASSVAASGWTKRLEGVLDRIEQLKNPTTNNNNNKKVIKGSSKQTDARSVATSSTSSYSKEEIAVLKRSSLISSGVFLPWSNDDAQELSNHVIAMTTKSNTGSVSSSRSQFHTDPKGDLALSEKQRKKFYKWARPYEICQIRQQQFGIKQQTPTMIRNVNPYSIRQQYVTDCSFIASLCICAAFEKRFRKPLIQSIIYPQNSNGQPMYNPEGKYIVKLWLNGVWRQVIIDDKLPIDQNSNLLCSDTSGSRNQLELWVTIIEKAYMKLCGGYDFPGSNSGIDLHSLTGWIPERIFFAKDPQKIRDFETHPERAWDRLFSACSFGDCLITVSTSRDITETQAENLGLVTGHAYAVLDVFQSSDGTRLLQLKNPWATKGWKGKYSCHDRNSWENNHRLRTEIGYNPELAAKSKDDGIFWISWDDVIVYFRNIQLSWNPALFQHSITTHSFWPKDQGPTSDIFNVGENPQYVLTLSNDAITKKATIWVLISRHVTKQEQEGCEVTDFLTIHMMRNTEKKERLWYPHGPNLLVNGAYSNNPSILSRYDVSGPEDKYISLILSQHQKSQDMGYTLSCYCTEAFTLGRPCKELPLLREFNGSWEAATAGGPVGKDGYFSNPMYLVHLKKDMTIQIRCSAAKSFAVNVMLISIPQEETNDYRRQTRKQGKPTLDSGNYRHGFAVTETKELPAGDYTLVVSTYSQGQLGVYNLKIASSLTPTIQAVR